jgi:hypothetical protein
MKCPKCHSNNPDDNVFCEKCATPLKSSEDIAASHSETREAQVAKFGLSVQDLARCVASLSEELFLEKIYEWSPRDIVAHLVGWNRYIIEGSKQIMRGELPFYDIEPGEDYSKVNDVLIREYSSRGKQELLDELQTSAQELKQFLQSLDVSEWDHDYGVKHQGATITIRNTIDDLIEDYDIHREQIKEWARGSPN